jgi:hypothetical protein
MLLAQALKEMNVPSESFFVLKHGETWISRRKIEPNKGLLHLVRKEDSR